MPALTFSAPKTLPPGRYPAILVDIGEGEGKFGDYLDWEFDVEDPDGEAKRVSRRTSTKTGFGAVARVFVEALLGRMVAFDEEVDLNGLIGRTVELDIETNDNGYDTVIGARPIAPDGTLDGGAEATVDDVAF
jgi:hypothetical protein